MRQLLRALQVEDSESDAALVVRALGEAGFRVESLRVETADEMRAALGQEQFHVVLADYNLPQFDAPGALAVLHESGQDLPFIVVSGMVGEEAAVAMMKSGAHDYVMKGSYARLGPAVERELREAQVRRDRGAAEQALRESEERFRTLFLQAPVGVALADLDGRLVDVNDAYCRMFGYSREEACGLSAASVVHSDYQELAREQFRALVEGSVSSLSADRRMLRKDGGPVWIHVTGTCIRAGDGTALYCLGMYEDITVRRRVERENQRLLETLGAVNELAIELTAARGVTQVQEIMAEKLREITDALAVSVSECSPQQDELVVARVAASPRQVGFLPQLGRILGRKVIGLRTPLADNTLREMLRTVVRRYSSLHEISFGTIPEAVARIAHDAFGVGELYGMALVDRGQLMGTCVLALRRGAPLLSDDLQSALARVCSVALSRARALEALRDSEARFATIFRASPLAIAVTRLSDRKLVDVNPAWSELAGWSAQRAIGRTTDELGLWLHPEARDKLLAGLERDGAPTSREVRLRRADGSLAEILLSAARVEIAGEDQVLTIATDIGARKKAEEALRVSEERFRSVFEAVRDGILLADVESMRFVMANPAICAMLGYQREELLRLRVTDIHLPEDLDVVRASFAEPFARNTHDANRLRVKRKDGSLFRADVHAVPLVLGGQTCLMGVFRDMTAFDAMEAQMRQAQKMEAIGQLAGSVAHDFNNILAVIMGYAESVQRRMTTRGGQHNRIEEIRRAAERGANLTRQLLAFSRRQVLESHLLDLNALIAGMVPMLRRLIGEDVTLATHCGQWRATVRADEGQLQQVLMNLAVNARDAMPHGGTLTIETARRDRTAPDGRASGEVAAGEQIVLSVRDTGHGMSDETLGHLFEPFFTTKELGKGTGLGLATVYGIVMQSGGTVEVESQVGLGTTFRIHLPSIEGEIEERRPAPAASSVERGTERILLLEDDPALRELERELLQDAGYQVLVAARPDEALSAVRDSPDAIDLLLSDVIMPEMSGPELASRLADRRPALKVLFVSGYTPEAIAKHGLGEPGVRLLQKPFTTEGLLRAVRSALDGTSGP